MPSWRDSASPQAQHDLDELLSAALGFAQQQLVSRGEFYPYAAATRADGQTEMIPGRLNPASEHPPAKDVIAACTAALRSRQHTIRAAAIVADVRLPELGSDAIEVILEHAEGPTLRVYLPYTKQATDISYGTLRAGTATRRIWAHSLQLRRYAEGRRASVFFASRRTKACG